MATAALSGADWQKHGIQAAPANIQSHSYEALRVECLAQGHNDRHGWIGTVNPSVIEQPARPPPPQLLRTPGLFLSKKKKNTENTAIKWQLYHTTTYLNLGNISHTISMYPYLTRNVCVCVCVYVFRVQHSCELLHRCKTKKGRDKNNQQQKCWLKPLSSNIYWNVYFFLLDLGQNKTFWRIFSLGPMEQILLWSSSTVNWAKTNCQTVTKLLFNFNFFFNLLLLKRKLRKFFPNISRSKTLLVSIKKTLFHFFYDIWMLAYDFAAEYYILRILIYV